MKTTAKFSVEQIKEMLLNNDTVLYRGIYQIFLRQTEDEKRVEGTKESNGIGFNGVDAPFLSSLAKQLIAKRTLSEKQTKAARKAMLKYSGQLTRIANQKAAQQ
jgi:hypothetical protein